jgi:phosphoserine aminotransferase
MTSVAEVLTTDAGTRHPYNFNAGPAVLPRPVLEQARAELLDYHGAGMSILEMSHRSAHYEAINAEAQARLQHLLGLDNMYRVLFLQGGASTQFAMAPLNFLPAGGVADYILTGSFAEKARDEAARLGQVHIAGSTKEERYRRLPRQDELAFSDAPAYVHLTSNNTIYGTQWPTFPDAGNRPLVADMSSDILSRPFDAARFALIYAGAQKNLGPAGVTVVIARQDFIDHAPNAQALPTMLRYATFAASNSLYNTPPVFAVYLLNLVLGWIETEGGLTALAERNERKARLLYDAIDARPEFYRGHAAPASRSRMNVTFRLPDEALEKTFIQEAQAAGFIGLAGHRSVGGIRVSIYNALDPAGCAALAAFMADFANRHYSLSRK